MTDRITFDVRGLPIPQGSARGFAVGNRVIITSANRSLSAWRDVVSHVAQEHAPAALWDGPVALRLGFRLPLPKGRPMTRGRGKKKHAIKVYPDRKPDLDKLIRSINDSLTNVVFRDDAQVVRISATKVYGVPGVGIRIDRVPNGERP